jgi:hypothetical protein
MRAGCAGRPRLERSTGVRPNCANLSFVAGPEAEMETPPLGRGLTLTRNQVVDTAVFALFWD